MLQYKYILMFSFSLCRLHMICIPAHVHVCLSFTRPDHLTSLLPPKTFTCRLPRSLALLSPLLVYASSPFSSSCLHTILSHTILSHTILSHTLLLSPPRCPWAVDKRLVMPPPILSRSLSNFLPPFLPHLNPQSGVGVWCLSEPVNTAQIVITAAALLPCSVALFRWSLKILLLDRLFYLKAEGDLLKIPNSLHYFQQNALIFN